MTADYSYPPDVVVDPSSGIPVVGATSSLYANIGDSTPVGIYDTLGNPIGALVSGPNGTIAPFKSDISVGWGLFAGVWQCFYSSQASNGAAAVTAANQAVGLASQAASAAAASAASAQAAAAAAGSATGSSWSTLAGKPAYLSNPSPTIQTLLGAADAASSRAAIGAGTLSSVASTDITDATATGRSIVTAASVAAARTVLGVPDPTTLVTHVTGTYSPGGTVLAVNGAWPTPPRPDGDATKSYVFVGPLTIDPPPAVASGTGGMQPQDVCIRG